MKIKSPEFREYLGNPSNENLEITKNPDSRGLKSRDPKIQGSEKPKFPETLGDPVKINPNPRRFSFIGMAIEISRHPEIRDFQNFAILKF